MPQGAPPGPYSIISLTTHSFECVYTSLRRRQWQPTPVLLPGKSQGWRSLVGCSPWHREESDTTQRLHFQFSLSCIEEGNGNPLQSSCLENPRDGGAWWAAVYGVAQSQTRLKQLSSSSSSIHLYTPMNWKESFTILKPYQVLLNHRNDQLLIHTSQWVHLTYIQLSEEARLMGDILENKFSEWWCEDIDELTFPLKQQKYRQND